MIELVSVLAIIVVLFSILLGSYSGWTRATGIDAAANLTSTIFSHARELAITQGNEARTRVRCVNFNPAGRPACGQLAVYTYDVYTNTAEVLAMPTNNLPAGICFRVPMDQPIEFWPDGTCHAPAPMVSNGCAVITIDSTAGNAGRRLSRVVEINQMSGRVRVRREDEP